MNFYQKFEQLPENVKEFLASNNVRMELEQGCFLYKIDADEIQKISKEVGLIFVGDFSLKDLPELIVRNFGIPAEMSYGIAYEINKRIFNRFPDYFKDSSALLQQWEGMKSAPIISENEAYRKLVEIEPWILEEEERKAKEAREKAEERRKYVASLVKIPFNEALRKYPDFGEQLITSNGITLPGFPDPVRPSIKNWIADYTATFGYEKNDPVKRNGYLFNSPNGRSLSQNDRERLSFILKAFEENNEVSFNQETKRLVFEEARAVSSAPSAPRDAVSFAPASQEKEIIPEGEMSFSYPQRMPFEKTSAPEPMQPAQPIQPAPSATPRFNTNPNIVKIPPKTITPKNVVNLKEMQ